ncbi:MAG: GNAT family N-acetyltransferase [Phyllobacteriaceae bacterium]|nr:GNAT family N-acetyltransferase [Phyllobacteriaceae bacterium]
MIDSLDVSAPLAPARIATARLVLRPPCAGDVPALARLADDRRIADMLSTMPHPYGEEEARTFVARAAAKAGQVFAISAGADNALIGAVGLSPKDGGVEIGYWIGRPHWGRGYATEAAQALVDHAFVAHGLATLEAECQTRNAASRRVLHKCGFQYAGQGMRDTLLCGRVAVERYRLARPVWAGLKSWGK